jgi:hypothetical protein
VVKYQHNKQEHALSMVGELYFKLKDLSPINSEVSLGVESLTRYKRHFTLNSSSIGFPECQLRYVGDQNSS